jgi:hypothetical protein
MTYRISTIIFIIFILGVLGLWYQGFRLYPLETDETVLQSVETPSGGISINDARKISVLKLDFRIFDDPIYKTLQLREVSVPAVSSILHGRSNPFIK